MIAVGEGGTSTAGLGPQARLDRAAPWAFALAIGVSFVALVLIGRHQWFSPGDLYLLTAPGPHDVFQPVEQHWTTVPILLFRGLLRIVGFRFVPYLVVAVTIHLGIAVLVWLVMRRATVRPWIATLATLPMLLFGPGYLSIIVPIQITQNLSILTGIGQLLLADHDGRNPRRDAIAVLVGLIGLMSSGVMPALVLATGVAILVRRGWRAAAVQTVPLAALFIGWYVWQKPNRPDYIAYQTPAYDLGGHVSTTLRGMVSAFEALGGSVVVAVILALVLAGGLVLRLTEGRPRDELRAIVVPVALAASSVVYIALVAFQRSASPGEYIEWSHHRYNVVVLCLPALGVAFAAIIGRWRLAAPAVVALVLVGAVPNVRFSDTDRPLALTTAYLQRARTMLVEAAADPSLDANAAARPDALVFANPYSGLGSITYAQLRAYRDAGQVPSP